jgi:hypothetical protein
MIFLLAIRVQTPVGWLLLSLINFAKSLYEENRMARQHYKFRMLSLECAKSFVIDICAARKFMDLVLIW